MRVMYEEYARKYGLPIIRVEQRVVRFAQLAARIINVRWPFSD